MFNFKRYLKELFYFDTSPFWIFRKPNKAVVLMYHSVGDNGLFFTTIPNDFKKQMAYLAQCKWKVVSLSSLFDLLQKGKDLRRVVALTFDDGYADFYFNVFPVLQKYNFKATIFLTTGYIGKQMPNSVNEPQQILSEAQIKDLHKSSLVDFEPHTITHVVLTSLDKEQAKKEVEQSKLHLEKILNKQCQFFVYPKGKYNQETITLLKELGFKAAFTTEEGLIKRTDNLFALPRKAIDSGVGFWQFKAKLQI